MTEAAGIQKKYGSSSSSSSSSIVETSHRGGRVDIGWLLRLLVCRFGKVGVWWDIRLMNILDLQSSSLDTLCRARECCKVCVGLLGMVSEPWKKILLKALSNCEYSLVWILVPPPRSGTLRDADESACRAKDGDYLHPPRCEQYSIDTDWISTNSREINIQTTTSSMSVHKEFTYSFPRSQHSSCWTWYHKYFTHRRTTWHV